MNLLRFKKIRNVESPVRGHGSDAGIDFYIPNVLNNKEGFAIEAMQILPHSDIRIPSGIMLDIPPGWCMTFLNKSGVSYNKKLIVGAQLIDSGYQGEVHFHLINVSSDNVYIKCGMKICQGIFIPVPLIKIEEVHGELFAEVSDRAQGGFGSTGS